MSETPNTLTPAPKEPLALLVKGRQPEEIVAWACGECGIVARSEASARRCCDRRCDCGAPTPRPYTSCDACRKKEWDERAAEEARKEQARLEKAAKVKWDDYDGKCIYVPQADGGGGGEGYFFDLGEFFDHFLDEPGVEVPTLVFACVPVKMSFNADDLISNACEEMYEDASGDVGQGARQSLQKALDVWCERHSPTSYTPNYALAVDLTAEVETWKAEQEGEAVASQTP